MVFSVTIHPDGLYIAAGFGDKIRLLNILIGEQFNIPVCIMKIDGDGDDMENIMALG